MISAHISVALQIIILMGAPGSGKGTQAKMLEHQLGWKHLSTGDLIRVEIAKGTELGWYLEEKISQGKLVKDDTVFALLKQALQGVSGGIILDGFPRTLAQAKMLQKMEEALNTPIQGVYGIQVSDDLVIDRLASRVLCAKCGASYNTKTHPSIQEGVCDYCGHSPLSQRIDDQPATIKVRLADYHQKNAAIQAFYKARDVWVEIPGDADPEDICAQIVRMVKNNAKKDQSKA